LAQTSLQNRRSPRRKGVSGCTVQWQPGQAQRKAVGLSRVVVMASSAGAGASSLRLRRTGRGTV
jgi:hypothetical protein